MCAYYGTRWRACEDHSPRATAPQQTCAHFLLECAPHELVQLRSHCSCSLSRSRLSQDASLFLSAAFSLSLSPDLSVSSHSAGSLSRSLCVVLRRSITFYIGAVDKIRPPPRPRFRLFFTSSSHHAFVRFLS